MLGKFVGALDLSEVRTNQIVAALSMPNMHLGGRPANQIAIRIECAKKAFFVTLETRFYPLKRVDRDKERIFDRGVVSPKMHSLPGSVVASTAIGKLKGHGYPWRSQLGNLSDANSSG